MMYVATEYNFKQLWASEIYGLIYVAFNVSFFYLGPEDEKVIYDILDWGEDPGTAATFAIVILLVLVPLFGFVHYGVFRCVGRGGRAAHFLAN